MITEIIFKKHEWNLFSQIDTRENSLLESTTNNFAEQIQLLIILPNKSTLYKRKHAKQKRWER